jgi:cytochrome c-type biogenesis protein CcmH
LRVRLGDDVSTSEMGAQAALFIFARAPGGGPPLAVIRQPVSALPGVFSLSDANAMIPGRSLADFQTISLVARVSANGQPVGQPGDLYGEVEYHPGQDPADVDLVVDQVQQ